MDVSIVIPTKNGGELLDKVLSAVDQQKTKYSYEVICVDSGSSDNTLDIIKKHKCNLFEILPADFGHGKTRNYGASKGSGEFIVFLTQDAIPASETWLEGFIDAIKSDDTVVGAFGKHLPYPDCNLLDKRDITGYFESFGSENVIYYMEDSERYKNDESYRHSLAFFSDNNSCLRRCVWEKYPYADVNFAEDQIWARQMIELGYKKMYCPFAPVYHSHNYPLKTYFKRYFDEYKGLYELHGFQIVKHWYYTIPAAFKHTLSDVRYIRPLNMKRREKIYWAWYSLWRNMYRYIGGYLGGRYHSYSEKKQKRLDRRISQQYAQRNGKKG